MHVDRWKFKVHIICCCTRFHSKLGIGVGTSPPSFQSMSCTLYMSCTTNLHTVPPQSKSLSYTSAWGWFSLSHCTCRKWELNHQKECFQNLSVRYTILYRQFDHKRVSLKVLTPKYFRSDHKSMRGPKFSENNDQFFRKVGPPDQNFRRTKISLTVLSLLVYDVIAVRWCDSMDMAHR